MLHKFVIASLLAFVAVLAGPATQPAHACPNCKESLSTDDSLPRAYQYSIIFMLTVPATIFTGFSYGFYRLSQQSAEKRGELTPELLAQYDARVPPAPNHSELP